jgi:hypothetical protein
MINYFITLGFYGRSVRGGLAIKRLVKTSLFAFYGGLKHQLVDLALAASPVRNAQVALEYLAGARQG